MPCLCAQATGQAAKSARTVVITGIPDGLLHNDVMTDILMIHFQMSKNNGGDVEEVTYPTVRKGVAYVTFEDQEGISINMLNTAVAQRISPRMLILKPNLNPGTRIL